jgi:hypothetical protein
MRKRRFTEASRSASQMLEIWSLAIGLSSIRAIISSIEA